VHCSEQRHHPQGQRRTTTYGQVADAAGKLEPPKDVPLKNPKDWTIAGKPLKRLDTLAKTNGTQMYGLDIKLPGMVVAAIKESPVWGGKVKSFDASKVAGRPGSSASLRSATTGSR
jgi:Aerobic-type carbon monoxide dehydrogenase, large subunit CoxL/CutL homologs